MKHLRFFVSVMASLLFSGMAYANVGSSEFTILQLSDQYILEWQQFFPSQALAAGDKTAAFRLENLSPQSVSQWLKTNHQVLEKLNRVGEWKKLSLPDEIDARLLKRQVLLEIENWEQDKWHHQSPAYYGELISQAMTHLLARQPLPSEQMRQAVLNRLKGIIQLCKTGITNLKDGSPERTWQCVDLLEMTAAFYQEKLPRIAEIQKWVGPTTRLAFQESCNEVAGEILKLTAFITTRIIPNMTLSDALGTQRYSQKLLIYTDSDIVPAAVETLALAEIKTVKEKMVQVASAYWQDKNPGKSIPTDPNVLVGTVLTDMEAHCAHDQQGFLQQFKDLIDRAEAFVVAKGVVTLPGKRTIFTDLSPAHFAGASVGGVYPAGPFEPEGDTLFYLPTVSDSAAEEVRDKFYRSFNTHFNTMIIAHEIVPGHYVQLKVATFQERRVRSLFGGDLFAEGWATLCEQFMLQLGWGDGDVLTYLAHLRKRLENAVRAYTSVQVHCAGWNKERLIRFAIDEGWLAPQFAENLWDRVMESPFQLHSYFLGYLAFDRLLQGEKARLGVRFSLRDFCDTVLRVGALPVDMLPLLFK